MMEYQKIINTLDNTSNQPSKIKAKNSFEINGNARGTYKITSQIKFSILMLKPSLWDYSDMYVYIYIYIYIYIIYIYIYVYAYIYIYIYLWVEV